MLSIIMTGGSGTRFWPVSRKHKPKQFLNITGNGPMVVETCDRLKSLAKDDEIVLILGQEHLPEARKLFKDRNVHMLAEPIGRNTAPCIGLGAIYAQHLGREEAIAYLPADHYIGDPNTFIEALKVAGELANSGGIVTLGIIPNRPETGYGYIKRAKNALSEFGKFKIYKVLKFVEKPSYEKACYYLGKGEYFWNGGIFLARPAVILNNIREHLPDLYKGLMDLQKSFETQDFDEKFKSVYEGLEAISFDFGIMEKTNQEVYVLPCECGWSDVGSWGSLYELKASEYDDQQNLVAGEALLIDCKNSFINSRKKRIVTCLGLTDCLVVDTEKTLLVADLSHSQDTRKIVAELKKLGKDDLL